MSEFTQEQHHPGPWYGDGYDIKCHPDDQDTGTTICEMISSRSPGETRKNRDLIASAPELAAQVFGALTLTETACQLFLDLLKSPENQVPLGKKTKIHSLLEQIQSFQQAAETTQAKLKGHTIHPAANTTLSTVETPRILHFPSSDGEQFCRLALIPPGMSRDAAEVAAQNVVDRFTQADTVHLESGTGEQPFFDKFLEAEGLVLLSEIIDGPVWD